MKAMSANIERIAGARLLELGSPVNDKPIYKHRKSDYSKYKINMNEADCITCTKHLTHIIPNKKQCKAICGTTKQPTR